MSEVQGLFKGLHPLVIGVSEFSIEQVPFVEVLTVTLIIVVLALFMWKFYRSLSKRDLFALKLNQYNPTSHPIVGKGIAIILYIIEYIILMPLVIMVWFIALSLILFILVNNRSFEDILLVAAGLLAAVRVFTYFNEELAVDLAKLFPLITLSVVLLSPDLLSGNLISEVAPFSLLFGAILPYLVALFCVETVLRMAEGIKEFSKRKSYFTNPK